MEDYTDLGKCNCAIGLGFIIWLASFWACTSQEDRTRENHNGDLPFKGKELAVQYCSGCHQYPKPELLDKSTWQNYVLPRMGYMLGIYPNEQTRDSLFEKNEGGIKVQEAKVFPESPLISNENWQQIRRYYLQEAPDHLPAIEKDSVFQGLPHFRVVKPQYRLSPPSTTMVRITNKGIFIGDAHTKRLYQFDETLKLQNAANVREGAVALYENNENLLVTIMGSFSPTDAASGLLLSLPVDTRQKPKVLLKDLQRPVQAAFGDLNEDGLEDFVICEFGKWTGCLSWWENQGNHSYKKHILRDKPGATRAYIVDVNGDNRPDIIALFGQGDEGVFIYYNEGNGNFKEEQVLQFPPSDGSSFFSMQDVNQDGFLDIVYTAGDNADYPPLLKPYHGVYLFVNDGNNHFSQNFFYPMPGAYKAIMNDFDLDGDQDIVAISFFPDFNISAKNGFVYLENQGENKFSAYTFPEADLGRWLVMDSGDVDKDGDMDIILGSLAFEVIPDNGLVDQWVENGIPFLLLENMIR